MPSYLIEVREIRTYEIDAASEDEARDIIERDEADLPVGALQSVERHEVSIRAREAEAGVDPVDRSPRDREPRPEMPTPRAF